LQLPQQLQRQPLEEALQPQQPLQLQLLVALEPQLQRQLHQHLEVLGLQPPPRQPLHLEALALLLLRLLQLLEALERQLPAQLVLALALVLLQHLQRQHLEASELPQPLRLPQLLEGLDQRQEQNRLHLEASELLEQLALAQALHLVLELEPQQVLEHLLQLVLEHQAQVLEREQGQDLELRQELVLLRAILRTPWNLSTMLCFNAVSIMMKEIASLPGGTCCKHLGAKEKPTTVTLLPQSPSTLRTLFAGSRQ